MRVGRLLPGRPRAREAARDRGLRRRDVRRARLATTTARASSSSSRRGRLGVRQRQPALVLRRGLEDARVRDRRAARLGDCPTPSSRPIALRLDVHEGLAGVRAVPRGSASSTGERPRLYGGQAEGCSPVAAAFAGATARVAGAARRRSRTRSRSAAPPTATSRSRPRARRAARSTRCRRTRSAPNMSLLAGTCGVFGETRRRRDGRRAPGGRCRAARSARATASSCSSPAPA